MKFKLLIRNTDIPLWREEKALLLKTERKWRKKGDDFTKQYLASSSPPLIPPQGGKPNVHPNLNNFNNPNILIIFELRFSNKSLYLCAKFQ